MAHVHARHKLAEQLGSERQITRNGRLNGHRGAHVTAGHRHIGLLQQPRPLPCYRAQEAFGINPDQSLADRLRARGFSESAVDRADTRQELSAPFSLGPVNLTPFVVGRVTAS